MQKPLNAAILLAATLAVSFLPKSTRAGTITGVVTARPPNTGNGQASGAYDSRRYKFVEKIDYDHLVDFVVFIDEPVTTPEGTGPAPAAITTQKDANFDPHVLPVAVGTTVRWPNQDDIFHNVFSMSDSKEFDLGLYKNEKVPEITFDRAGRIDVFCAIHTKMTCIIYVVPNRFFAKTDAKGRYTLKDVPRGTYKVRAWHERLPTQTFRVTVPEQGDVKQDFVLGFGAATQK